MKDNDLISVAFIQIVNEGLALNVLVTAGP